MATMQDVARRAGVALSTVSYALSGARSVAPDTVIRVQQAMEELGYRPNAAARSLARGRSRILAMNMPRFDPSVGETVFEIARGARREAARHGFHLAIWPLDDQEAPRELVELVGQGHAEGVLLLEVSLGDSRALALTEARIPTVLIGRTGREDAQDVVDIDFEDVVERAVTDMIEAGRTDLLLLTHGSEGGLSSESRYGPAVHVSEAFIRAAERRGASHESVECEASPSAGRRAARRLLHAAPRRRGVIAMNDLAVLGLVDEIQSRGLAVPKDLAVTTIVSSPRTSTMTTPTLTGWAAPGEDMGALAVRALLDRIETPSAPPQRHLLRCTPIIGASVRPPRSQPSRPAMPTDVHL